MPESLLLRKIFRALGSLRHVRLFRNNVGQAIQGRVIGGTTQHGSVLIENPRRIQYGLIRGSSDLIGWTSRVITPDMVGRRVAIFTAIEVKEQRRGSRLTPDQRNFIGQVKAAGGIAGEVRSVEDAMRAIRTLSRDEVPIA